MKEIQDEEVMELIVPLLTDRAGRFYIDNEEYKECFFVNTVDEFKGMNPKDVVQYIEGEPLIGVVPIETGMTNSIKESPAEKGKRIVSFNSENMEINEGLVRFDIVFYVRMKDGLSQMIVNVES